MHEQLYLAVSHIYGSRFRCLNMVKMSDVNNFDLKDTDLASLITRNWNTICASEASARKNSEVCHDSHVSY